MKRLVLLAAMVAGCAGQPVPAPAPASAPPSAANDAAWYRQAESAGSKVLVIDPAQSLIAVTVRSGGPLARLGHDHVVASRTVTGFVAPDRGRADFSFRLDQMTVDEPALRREAQLTTQPSEASIAGTRENMLGRVLEADRFPLVALRADKQPGAADVRLSITLHGVTRTLMVPARIESSAGGVIATGMLQLRQTDFGITPMSVMAGAMTVQDAMELRFRMVARPR